MDHGRRRPSRLVLLPAALALLLPLASSAQLIRLGTELQVNTYTTDFQVSSAVAAEADGDFVVAWASNLQDGSLYGIFARRFSSAGAPLAAEFQVNTFTSSSQSVPAIAIESDGDFVVVWQSANQEGASYGVFGRRFSSSGAAVAAEFQANTFVLGHQYHPSVAASASGDLVIAWSSNGQDGGAGTGVFARRFSSAGTPLATEFQVNDYTPNQQDEPSVAVEPDGDFVVAWSSYGQDKYSTGVFARRFTSTGARLATEFQVNVSTVGFQENPWVKTDADGDFVIAWTSYSQSPDDFVDVFARRFTSSGAAKGGEFQLNVYTTSRQRRPVVATRAGGDFLVTWESYEQDSSSVGVFARHFSAAGTPLAAELQVHTYTSGVQRAPKVAASNGGRFVVTWQSVHDGSSSGIFSRRLGTLATLDIDGNFSVSPLTDGILLLRYLFGFRGDTLVNGAVDLQNCTRCSAVPIEPYLAAPPLPLAASEPALRQGAEFQVNDFTSSYQFSQRVAANGAGGFVVVWVSVAQDGSGYGVFGRRFSSAGARLATEFQVTTYTSGLQGLASLGAETNGDFVVAWNSQSQGGSGHDVLARRFSSAGSALPPGLEIQINTYTTNEQTAPALAVDADGDFVVAWQSIGQDGASYGIFARRFSSAGTPLATELQVNTHTLDAQEQAAAAIDADGDFVIAWQSDLQDGSNSGIFARRFSSAGVAVAGEFQVNRYTISRQRGPSLSMDADGDFLAAWTSTEQDGSSEGVFGRRFSSSGSALAAEFQINAYTTERQSDPRIAALADGTFVVAWTTIYQDGSFDGSAARRFTSTGVALTPEFQLNTYTQFNQRLPHPAAGNGSRFLVVWDSLAQDGSDNGVFAQRFVVAAAFDIDGNGLLEALTDGLLALRYLFGFRGATLINGAIGAGCTRCDAPAIEAYLAALTS